MVIWSFGDLICLKWKSRRERSDGFAFRLMSFKVRGFCERKGDAIVLGLGAIRFDADTTEWNPPTEKKAEIQKKLNRLAMANRAIWKAVPNTEIPNYS